MTKRTLGDAEWATLEEKLQLIGRIWKHGHDEDNRRFVQGVCYLLRTGLPWADLPDEFGKSDTVRKRFRRWCKAGIWRKLFEGTVPAGNLGKLMLDGTICKAHRSAAGARGGAEEDVGRSRGGLTTKIGAAVCATTQKVFASFSPPASETTASSPKRCSGRLKASPSSRTRRSTRISSAAIWRREAARR
jgi:transposase